MTKIYLYFDQLNSSQHGSCGYAFNEQGEVIHSHFSSDKNWSKHDLGLESDWGHEEYKKYYPDGFELVWIDDPNHPVLKLSREKSKQHMQKITEVNHD